MKEETSLSAKFNRLYGKHSAEIDKSYKARQVAFIKWADKRYLKGNSKTLLDIGCGNGVLLSMLKHSYQSKGLDISKEDIALARQKVKGVEFITANMLNFELKEKFDIITCFDAIDHGDDLRKGIIKTLSNMYRHLENNGMLIFSLSMAKDCWINGETSTTVLSVKGGKFISTTHRCIRNNELNFDIVTLLLKGSKTYQEFKTTVLKYDYGLLETAKVRDITNNLGFKTFVYRDWSDKVWSKESSEQPIFVCVKRR
ncbi:MAG: methyltransferase domain-containing protein [Candidatus Micrarchaeaceae archaeon]